MNKHIVFAICGCLFYFSGMSQTKNFDDILIMIEENNKELKAFKTYIESKMLSNSSANNLPNPEVSIYYLPFGSSNSDPSYSEFEIVQSFEFPTVYGARKQWNTLKAEKLEVEYQHIRQDILLKSTKLLNELFSLHKQKEIEEHRHEQSEKVYLQIKKLFEEQQVGVLELNKAKIAWMQLKFHVEQVEIKQITVLKQLTALNGDLNINLNQTDFINKNEVGEFELLWSQKLNSDPELLNLKLNEATTLQELKLEKNKSLPNLNLGFNNQGVSGNRISGFVGGLSIPIWNSKNKVKAVRSKYDYQTINTEAKIAIEEARYFEQFSNYQLLLKKFEDYKQTLSSLNGDELLFKAYTLGEYSFMQYYIELEFYHKAYDDMLQMELELHQLKAELVKHNL